MWKLLRTFCLWELVLLDFGGGVTTKSTFDGGVKMKGLKFKYLSFDKIAEEYKGISVWIDGKEVA